jgi:predicted SAM-dependent methyltransferase
MPGWTNVDICSPCDQIADLNKRWPWADSSVHYIVALDIFEHLRSPIHSMNEAWRVLILGGKIDIMVPTTDGRGAFQDPTHVSFWNRNSFKYYEHNNGHNERFAVAYGIHCAFNIISEIEQVLVDQVLKLRIVLEAVKP